MILDADGINPQTDVELIQVTTDACITAMNGTFVKENPVHANNVDEIMELAWTSVLD